MQCLKSETVQSNITGSDLTGLTGRAAGYTHQRQRRTILEETTIKIEVTMRTRWIPHFVGMLKTMQRLGNLGSSRVIGFYADGDGDFRPKFVLPEIAEAFPVYADDCKTKDAKCDYFYDAG